MQQINDFAGRLGGVYLLPVVVAALAFVMIGAPSSWVTLTVAGLAMGMMIFLMASGLSLVFGLMDVLNFGHSAFVSFGAFIAASVLAWLSGWLEADAVSLNIAALFLAFGAAILAIVQADLQIRNRAPDQNGGMRDAVPKPLRLAQQGIQQHGKRDTHSAASSCAHWCGAGSPGLSRRSSAARRWSSRRVADRRSVRPPRAESLGSDPTPADWAPAR